jgi:periplasmic divalent cation tolerance protein
MDAIDNVSHLVVLTTLSDAGQARSLVRRLVERRLVACGSIVDRVDSIYWWEGKLEEAGEALVLLKTRRDRWTALREAVQELHPYAVPELLALPVQAGLEPYLAWLDRETVPVEENV